MRRDPAAIEVPGLGSDALAIDEISVKRARVKCKMAAQGCESRTGLGIAPGDVAKRFVPNHDVEIDRLTLPLANGAPA
jgi:hypothetical protein